MEIKAIYLLAHISIGFISGYFGIYINLESHKTKAVPYHLFLAIVYIFYMAVMMGLAKTIGWIGKHTLISQPYIGLSGVLALLSVYPGVLLAKKLLRK